MEGLEMLRTGEKYSPFQCVVMIYGLVKWHVLNLWFGPRDGSVEAHVCLRITLRHLDGGTAEWLEIEM